MNKIQVIGRVGKDPELKNFDNGGSIVNFSIATTEKWKTKDGEQKEETQWHNVKCTSKLNDTLIKYVKKGQLLYIEGRMKYRKYKDSNDVEKTVAEINLDSMEMLGGNKQSDESESTEKDNNYGMHSGQAKETFKANEPEPTGDDIPF